MYAFTGFHIFFRHQGPDLQNILRQSYNNAKVTIDLGRTSNLQNILRRTQGFSWAQFGCKIVSDSVRTLAYDIPKSNLSTL